MLKYCRNYTQCCMRYRIQIGTNSRRACDEMLLVSASQLYSRSLLWTLVDKSFLVHFLLFLEPVLLQLTNWINEFINLEKQRVSTVYMYEIHQFFGIVFSSQLSKASIEKSLENFMRLGHHCPTLEIIRFIISHLQTHSPTASGPTTGATCIFQSHETERFAAF